MTREQVCSQYCCLSCPLSLGPNKCREKTQEEINIIMTIWRKLESAPQTFTITEEIMSALIGLYYMKKNDIPLCNEIVNSSIYSILFEEKFYDVTKKTKSIKEELKSL